MPNHFETTIKSDEVYNGRIITVTNDTVLLENGKTATRDVVHHNGGASVAALDECGNIVLVSQYRHPFGCEITEIPAGKLEFGEDPFEAAKRELAEETGFVAADYIDLGYIIPTCGYCSEKIYIYGAKNLTKTEINLDEDEFVTVFKLPLEKAFDLVMNGEITDSKTVAAILKLHYLRAENKF